MSTFGTPEPAIAPPDHGDPRCRECQARMPLDGAEPCERAVTFGDADLCASCDLEGPDPCDTCIAFWDAVQAIERRSRAA